MFFLVQKRPRQCFRGPLFLVLHQKTQHSFQHHPAFIFRDFSFPSLLYISSNILSFKRHSPILRQMSSFFRPLIQNFFRMTIFRQRMT